MYITAAVGVVLVLLYFFVFKKGVSVSRMDPDAINRFESAKWECINTPQGLTCGLKSDENVIINLQNNWVCSQDGNNVDCVMKDKPRPTKINVM
jgi:hypothetical protein